MKYAYYPGCSLHGLAQEYERSALSVGEALGVTLEELTDWACCGATPAHATNHLLSVALPAWTLAQVPRNGDQPPILVTACAACFNRLRTANYQLWADEGLRAQVEEVAEIECKGPVEVRHLLDILHTEVGLTALQERVARPLEGLKVACYYGCLLTRPPKITASPNPENPQTMEELLTAVGATCVNWPYKTECCGGTLSLSRPDLVYKLVNDLLREAKEAEAEALAVACPLCQANLDLRQSDVERRYQTSYNLPIFYFTQLLGLALGLDRKALGLERLIVDPKSVLQKLGA
ncbi:MAG TPA: heterodisulfide reductase subunit B [Armatimonadetes bacterium]|nr:heterodisulfide reductase subunit B [Armatimonadota bacterium]